MSNPLQTDNQSLEFKFEARQTDVGAALLFSIADGALYMTMEIPGLVTEWRHHDLSSARIRRDLPNGRCTDFATAQSVPLGGEAGALHLAMVVSDGGTDHLYLSLSNPAYALGWRAAPVWIACPFNAGPPPARMIITRVQIGDANDHAFVVVDAVVDAGMPRARPVRYYVEAGRGTAPRWVEHRVPGDIGVRMIPSCLGRCRGGWDVDGLYLTGQAGDRVYMLYAPLYNPFNLRQPPWSRHLEIPGKLVPEALAACRHADNTSDLYVTAGGALYYFSAANQNEGAQGLRIVAAPAFEGVKQLFVERANGHVTVWGLTQAGRVVHTRADAAYVADPDAWSASGVILTDVDAIAPFPQRGHADDTLFAHTATGLVELVRSSSNSVWIGHDVVLPRQDGRAIDPQD